MLDGLHHVWRAAEILAGGDAGLRERLKDARIPLRLALSRPEEWPPGLLPVAQSIERILGERGALDPLEGMDSDLARQAAEDLLGLAFDVQAAFARERCQETTPIPPAVPSGGECWQPA